MGGVPRHIFGDPSDLMRLPDDVLQSVAFLGLLQDGDDISQIKLGGTAFFVSMPSASRPALSYVYLVTAKHCVQKPLEMGGAICQAQHSAGRHGVCAA